MQGDDAECGLFWNEDMPMKRELANALWLPLPKDKTVTVRLTADAKSSTATVHFDDAVVDSLPYTPTVQHGLYFVLRNAKLLLKNIKVIAG